VTAVREEREHAGVAAAATVRTERPGPEARRLAGAAAYARIGRRLLASGAAEDAVAAARAGLEEAGRTPVDPEHADDTKLKLFAAEERLADGHAADAADVMLDVLEIRMGLHAAAQGAAIED
jgi:hypothetical protein